MNQNVQDAYLQWLLNRPIIRANPVEAAKEFLVRNSTKRRDWPANRSRQGFWRSKVHTELEEILNHRVSFTPGPVYSEDGDFLSLFVRDSSCYAERVDDTLTVYKDDDTDELVGCKIKGVTSLLKKMDASGILVHDKLRPNPPYSPCDDTIILEAVQPAKNVVEITTTTDFDKPLDGVEVRVELSGIAIFTKTDREGHAKTRYEPSEVSVTGTKSGYITTQEAIKLTPPVTKATIKLHKSKVTPEQDKSKAGDLPRKQFPY